jgi:hypothetical protein
MAPNPDRNVVESHTQPTVCYVDGKGVPKPGINVQGTGELALVLTELLLVPEKLLVFHDEFHIIINQFYGI